MVVGSLAGGVVCVGLNVLHCSALYQAGVTQRPGGSVQQWGEKGLQWPKRSCPLPPCPPITPQLPHLGSHLLDKPGGRCLSPSIAASGHTWASISNCEPLSYQSDGRP